MNSRRRFFFSVVRLVNRNFSRNERDWSHEQMQRHKKKHFQRNYITQEKSFIWRLFIIFGVISLKMEFILPLHEMIKTHAIEKMRCKIKYFTLPRIFSTFNEVFNENEKQTFAIQKKAKKWIQTNDKRSFWCLNTQQNALKFQNKI